MHDAIFVISVKCKGLFQCIKEIEYTPELCMKLTEDMHNSGHSRTPADACVQFQYADLFTELVFYSCNF